MPKFTIKSLDETTWPHFARLNERSARSGASEDRREGLQAEGDAAGIFHGTASQHEMAERRMDVPLRAFERLRLEERIATGRAAAEIDRLGTRIGGLHAGAP